MAAIVKTLVMLLLLNVIPKGYGQYRCSLKNIHIHQIRTIHTIKGNSVWKVIVSNNCECSQMYIRLECEGFTSAEMISPSILTKTGRTCLVNNGAPVYGYNTFSFTYASTRPYFFKPSSSTLACLGSR